MNSNINERLLIFLQHLNTPFRQIEITLGFSNGSLGKLKKGVSIGIDKLEKIVSHFTQLNPSWLLKEEGDMLLSSSTATEKETQSSYSSLKQENTELKEDKKILTNQILLKDKQIKRLWEVIDELKK